MRKAKRSLENLFGTIDRSLQDAPAAAASVQRVKDRLLERVARDTASARPHTVHAGDGAWQACGPGLQMKVLHRSEDSQSYLLRLAPGAALPAHEHPIDEECLVLEGELLLEGIVAGAGAFHLAPRGAIHHPITTRTGALIFLRGAIPRPEHFRV
jgi:anti-sigma factor ChrR (cupin superfamily)